MVIKKSLGMAGILAIGLLMPFKASAVDYAEYSKSFNGKLSEYSVIHYAKSINTIKLYSYIPSNVTGLTNYYNHSIIISNTVNVARQQHILHHESGHVLDTLDKYDTANKVIGTTPFYYSSSTEFTDIFNLEKNSINSYTQEMYSRINKSEYFAECFAWFIENPVKLQQSSPKTYDYMNKLYNSMK